MKRYIVTNTILGRGEGCTPQDVTWYRGENPVQAISAVTQAIAMAEGLQEESNLPESMKYDVTSVRLDVHQIEPEPKPEWDTEGYVYPLSDCKHGLTPGPDCSGPRVGVTRDGVILCEGHYNSMSTGE